MKYVAMIVVGLLLGGVAGYMSWQRMAEIEAVNEAPAYLVLRADLPDAFLEAGSQLRPEHLTSIQIPETGGNLGDYAFPDSAATRQFVTLQPINMRLPRGRILTRDLFEDVAETRLDQVITPGMRALTISVDTKSALNYQVAPGNRVDLIGVRSNLAGSEAEILMEDVKVIAVGDMFSYDEWLASGRDNYSTLTLEMTPQDALALSQATPALDGPVSVVLRSQCDTDAATDPGCL
ncbi:hypothetical protein AN189_18185 [Loktanella sp. 3ANDIMAR09]|uniref:Flp pilus assembly protein CpaB n=1 Tax=Loktanella sp. 3ANDIMAR09 TaxID=1225657 RepID=UPI0006F68FC5|nr:Flp pilus assembly protein CpaB [Loktanella sp. 3ANDIMAR09]KQI66928.1 hypothetical protein AN189_18185 [Loktanella sp. 3ANDIMAR09]